MRRAGTVRKWDWVRFSLFFACGFGPAGNARRVTQTRFFVFGDASLQLADCPGHFVDFHRLFGLILSFASPRVAMFWVSAARDSEIARSRPKGIWFQSNAEGFGPEECGCRR